MPLAAPDKPAEDIAAADDDGDLDAEVADLFHLGRDRVEHGMVDAVPLIAHEGLARELEQYAFVSWLRHVI